MSEKVPRRNALAGESSPYLLLHDENPVDWYPWGGEALARAREEDKPIFLSVGYSTCYWCHVMERESFSAPEIAALMNEHFINIKVDREERPDLDEIYMVATQVLTDQGGWPNSVFLTPDLKPFFAGTYFPPRDAKDRPGFPTVLRSLAEAWTERRGDIEEQGESVVGALRHYLEERDPPIDGLPGAEPAERSLRLLERQFDPVWGGFGTAPKFPSVPNLWLLEGVGADDATAATMLETTLDRMARGGIYDQIGGGFHRYATDQEWTVPHFEKMLCDNGLLLELYARDFERNGSEQSERITRETAAFLIREMSSRDGGFWSAIDAETDGVEGRYYVWSQNELIDALSREDAAFLAPMLGFQGGPFFRTDYFVLHWPEPLAVQAERRQASTDVLFSEVRPMLDRLLAVRDARKRPLTDDKILTDWNGMVIAGLAEAGRVLGDPQLLARAQSAAEFVLARMRSENGPLLHSWRDGRGQVQAFLADYAFLVRGLLTLSRAVGDEVWCERAVELIEEQEARLAAPEGGYFAAAETAELVVRSRDVYDGALPSANSVAVINLLDLHRQTGADRWLDLAARALRAHGALVEQRPEAARTLALASRRLSLLDVPALSATPAESEIVKANLVLTAIDRPLEKGASVETYKFELELVIRDGWRIGAPAGEAVPAAEHGLELHAMGATLIRVDYPEGTVEGEGIGLGRASFYRGSVVLSGELKVEEASPRISIVFQPCDEARCLPPAEIMLRVDLPQE